MGTSSLAVLAVGRAREALGKNRIPMAGGGDWGVCVWRGDRIDKRWLLRLLGRVKGIWRAPRKAWP